MIFNKHTNKNEDPDVREWFKDSILPLNSEEHQKGRALLQEYMKLHPVRRESTPSPYSALGGIGAAIFSSRYGMPAAALILVMIVTTGTAYAAEGSLPGDPLYGFKINVTEEVRGALAVGAKAQADWSISRAERRLEEASTLAVKGDLNAAAREGLESNLNEHIATAESNKTALANKSNTADANDVEVHLGAVLNAHAGVLGTLQTAVKSDDTRSQVSVLLADIDTHILASSGEPETPAASLTTMAASATITPAVSTTLTAKIATSVATEESTNPIDQKTVKRERTLAKARILSAKSSLSTIKSKLPNAETTELWVRAQAQVNAADAAYAEGETSYKAKAYNDASPHYNDALRIAADAEALLNARSNVLQELIKISPEINSSGKGENSNDNNWDHSKKVLESSSATSSSVATTSAQISTETTAATVQTVTTENVPTEGDGSPPMGEGRGADNDNSFGSARSIFHAVGNFGF